MSESLSITSQIEEIQMNEVTEYVRPAEKVAIATRNTDRLIKLGKLNPKERQVHIDSYFPLTKQARIEHNAKWIASRV